MKELTLSIEQMIKTLNETNADVIKYCIDVEKDNEMYVLEYAISRKEDDWEDWND